MKKNLFMLCVMLSSLSAPSVVFAYGEDSDLGYDVPIESRQMQLLVNEARADTKTAIATCKDENCLEKSCYNDAKPPYFWNDVLFRAAQFHSNNMKYRDESISKDGGIAHDSPCKLVTNIASLFPTCWGQAGCACQGGKFSGTTESHTRHLYFAKYYKLNTKYLGFAEGIAQSTNDNSVVGDYLTTGPFYVKDSPAYYFYKQLITENALGATGTKNKCETSNNNGHRFAIIGENYNTIGVGNNCAYYSDGKHCTLVLNYITVDDLGIPNNLTAGSHYKSYNTLWFKTHYYSKDKDVKKVVLSIGDQCVSLKQTGGLSKKNAVFATSSLYDIPECTPYFYESVDEAGNTSRFPSTGSLLYIPVDFTQTPHCEGKTWQSANVHETCLDTPDCQENEHIYGNNCEIDTIEDCGIHEFTCKDHIEGWETGSCSNGNCILETCDKNHYMALHHESCLPNDKTHCGGEGDAFNCSKTSANWNDGICFEAQCIATRCKSGFHPEDGKCVANTDGVSCNTSKNGYKHEYQGECEESSVENCGAHGYQCKTYNYGWKEGECNLNDSNKWTCQVTECEEGYKLKDNKCMILPVCRQDKHLDDETCVDDTLSACGSIDNDCTTYEGWADGLCVNGQCNATGCTDDFYLDGTTCMANDIHNCGAKGFDCTTAEGWASGQCILGECVIESCQDNYELNEGKCELKPEITCDDPNQHPYEDACVDNDVNNCGEHGRSCHVFIDGWNDGSCTDAECIVTSCISGMHVQNNTCVENTANCDENQHEYEDSCEDDTPENCGFHGNQCDETISGWKDGSCEDSQCVVKECTDGLTVKNNKCVEGASEDPTPVEDEQSSSSSDDCSGTPMNHSNSAPWLMMLGLAGLGVIRRRKFNA